MASSPSAPATPRPPRRCPPEPPRCAVHRPCLGRWPLMLGALLLVVVIVATILIILFGALCLAIRNEDRPGPLACRPPTLGTAFARCVLGLSVRRTDLPVQDDSHRGPYLVSHG